MNNKADKVFFSGKHRPFGGPPPTSPKVDVLELPIELEGHSSCFSPHRTHSVPMRTIATGVYTSHGLSVCLCVSYDCKNG